MIESFGFATDESDVAELLLKTLDADDATSVVDIDYRLASGEPASYNLGQRMLHLGAERVQTLASLGRRVALHFRLPASDSGRMALHVIRAALVPNFGFVARASSPLLDAMAEASRAYVLPEGQDIFPPIERLGRLIFGQHRLTPTPSEYGMHVAFSGTLRSGALRGGVGASIVDSHGDVLAVGTAEVPRAGGGQYWADDANDARDLVRGYDPATRVRQQTVEVLLGLLARWNVNFDEPPAQVAAALLKDFDAGQCSAGVGQGSQLAQSFESLGRVVHAEMAALCSCARHGVRVSDCTMFTTASPCRQCLRHLICAGISKVVYFGRQIDGPPDFHSDAVSTAARSGYVSLEPFAGTSPALYEQLFGSRSAHEIKSIRPALLWSTRSLTPPKNRKSQ